MSKIYVNQTALRINTSVNEDITGASVKIKYKKPDNTTGEWIGVIDKPSSGGFYYDATSTEGVYDIDMKGKWTLWAEVTFANGNIALGEPTSMQVYLAGE